MDWSSSGQAVTSIKSTDRSVCRVFKNSEKRHFHNSEEKFKHYLRIYEKLIKILIEVKRLLLIRISIFPVYMHNFIPI